MVKIMQTHKNYPQRTHIIPVGNQEIERILQPLYDLRPEKIYLLTKSGVDVFSDKFVELKSKILAENIVSKENFKEIKVDYYNLTVFMQLIAKICKEEYDLQNSIYYNLSGGTMLSVAGTLACIYFGVTPYFEQYDYKAKKIIKGAAFPKVPNLFFNRPNKKQTHFLYLLQKYQELEKISEIKKNICLQIINQNKLEKDLAEVVPNSYNKLSKRYLIPLEQKKYIKINPTKKKEVIITPDGVFVAKIFGAFYGFE